MLCHAVYRTLPRRLVLHFTTSLMPSLRHVVSLAVFPLALCGPPLPAQEQPHTHRSRTPATFSREDIQFADRVALSATIELALVGIRNLADHQRVVIEDAEQSLRDSIAQLGIPVRRARRLVQSGWPPQSDLFEREINAIAVVRSTALEQVRASLTRAQQLVFDRNLLVIGDFDISMWIVYSKPYMGTQYDWFLNALNP